MITAGNSLYFRLVARVGTVLVVSGAALLVAILFTARIAANQAYDRILVGNALQIAENIWYDRNSVTVDVPLAALARLSGTDKAFYAVIDPDGRTIAGDLNFRPSIPWETLKDGPVLADGTYEEHPVRLAFIGRRLPMEGPHPWAVVAMAQTRAERASFAQDLTTKAFVVVLVMGALTLVAAMFTLYQAMSPLQQIERSIRGRDPHKLSPLSLDVPTEIHALVVTMNDFMRRLAVHQEVTRRLIGDAAHQLRTPVTALLSQMELLSAQGQEDRRRAHIARLQVLIQDLASLVNQLINHAMVQLRAESTPHVPVDLKELVRSEMADVLSSHTGRQIDLAMIAPEEPCTVKGDATTLRAAVRILLDNALQYGAPSLLHVELVRKLKNVELRFIDDGPGIPPTDWDRLRKPFSPRGGGRSGASLGLSIVQETVRSHRGRLQFAMRTGRFMVTLIFRAHA